MEKDNIPFPDRLVNYYDIAKGIGEIVFHKVFDHLQHPGISDHNLNFPENQDGIITPK